MLEYHLEEERERDNMLHLGTRVKQKKRIGSNLDQSETTQRQDKFSLAGLILITQKIKLSAYLCFKRYQKPLCFPFYKRMRAFF